MFVIDAGGYLVGFSFWEADPLYTPVVGLYVDNAIVAHAPCKLPPQSTSLDGPPSRYWFRLNATIDQLERIELGDPAVKLLRVEDATPIRLQRSREEATAQPIHRVEDFLTNAEHPTARLDGFPKYITAPLAHQLDVLFIDILGRRPDPGAKAEYLPRLRQGETILGIRDILMNSEEFRERRLTISDRVGSLITSSLWTLFARTEPLGERRPSVRRMVMADYATLSDPDFVIAAHRDCHGDDPTEPTVVDLAGIAATRGRREVVDRLRRDAATGGRYFDVLDA